MWKEQDIKTALNDPLPENSDKTKADVFCYHFNVKTHGNVDLSKVILLTKHVAELYIKLQYNLLYKITPAAKPKQSYTACGHV